MVPLLIGRKQDSSGGMGGNEDGPHPIERIRGVGVLQHHLGSLQDTFEHHYGIRVRGCPGPSDVSRDWVGPGLHCGGEDSEGLLENAGRQGGRERRSINLKSGNLFIYKAN